jgi:hypothetical protein
MNERRIMRYDRHGQPEYAPSTSPATLRAVAILQAAVEREARESRIKLKTRQDSGQLNPQELLLSSIFGEIK